MTAKKIKEWLDEKAINEKEYEAFLNLKDTIHIDPNTNYELERLWKALIASWSSISSDFGKKKIVKEWIVRGFTKIEETREWFNRIGKSPFEADFARWLKDVEHWTAPDELNGWLTDDNIAYIIQNRELKIGDKEIPKSSSHRLAGDFRIRTDVATIYKAFLLVQKDYDKLEFLEKYELDSFVEEWQKTNLISKKKYTIFPIRVSGNHWGMFIIGDDDSGLTYNAYYTSSGHGVENELKFVKPLIERLTDNGVANSTRILEGQKQNDGVNCGVYLIFYIWNILKQQKVELNETYTNEGITIFRQKFQTIIGKDKWCLLDSYWMALRLKYQEYIKLNPWTNPYKTNEEKNIDWIIFHLNKWMYEVIDEKFAVSDKKIREDKDIQIDTIKDIRILLEEDEKPRNEQCEVVQTLLIIFPKGYSQRVNLEYYINEWVKILGIDTPKWKIKQIRLALDIENRLAKYPVELEFNQIGKSSFRGKDTWQKYLDTVNQEGSIGDTIEGSFYFVESNLLYPLAQAVIEYLLNQTFSKEEKLKNIEEYINKYQHDSEKAIYLKYKNQIDNLKNISLLWITEIEDKKNTIKNIENKIKTSSKIINDEQINLELEKILII